MYINPIIVGALGVLLIEFSALFIAAVVKTKRRGK